MSSFLDVLGRYNILDAYWVNLKLAVLAGLFAFVLGVIVALMRISPIASLQKVGTAYVTIMRNTPLTVIIVFGVLVLWPVFGVNFSPVLLQNMFWLAVFGLTIYHASFFCEAIRSGVNTVPVGQAEAARAIGLSFLPAARLVIMPQALRGSIAPIGNTLIALLKNTTVAAAGSVNEISLLMKEMIENHGNYVFPIFLTVAAGFVVLVIPIGLLTTFLSQKLAVSR